MATPNAQVERPELIDNGEVSAMGVGSKRHVRRLSDAGKMPRPLKIGRLVRWRRQEILDWIEAGCPASEPRTTTSRRPRSCLPAPKQRRTAPRADERGSGAGPSGNEGKAAAR